jgi:uncharacterized membrane protein YhaH (DUF805 family)
LEAHRIMFSERFLPDLKFWLEWMQERISSTSPFHDELKSLDDLFEMALSQCASAEIAKEWIDNIVHRFEAELMVMLLSWPLFLIIPVLTVISVIFRRMITRPKPFWRTLLAFSA